MFTSTSSCLLRSGSRSALSVHTAPMSTYGVPCVIVIVAEPFITMVGDSLSVTTTVLVAVASLPELSVQVYVTVYDPRDWVSTAVAASSVTGRLPSTGSVHSAPAST